MPLRGGVGPLMANAILNFHFDYLTTSLSSIQNDAHFQDCPSPTVLNYQFQPNRTPRRFLSQSYLRKWFRCKVNVGTTLCVATICAHLRDLVTSVNHLVTKHFHFGFKNICRIQKPDICEYKLNVSG